MNSPTLSKEQLLAEVEDLLRTAPANPDEIYDGTPENFSWIGRLSAAVGRWSTPKSAGLAVALVDLRSGRVIEAERGWRHLMMILHEARHDLRMSTTGPITVAVNTGMTFDYFDEIRKLIERAKADLFFVDPFLDADFVSRYLVHAQKAVPIRLLSRERKCLATLIPAAQALTQQNGNPIAVRSYPSFHDRYLIVDGTEMFQTGASFKDGGRTAPTAITQITDAFAVMKQTYEDMWAQAKIEL